MSARNDTIGTMETKTTTREEEEMLSTEAAPRMMTTWVAPPKGTRIATEIATNTWTEALKIQRPNAAPRAANPMTEDQSDMQPRTTRKMQRR